ncbi:MAG TPA: triose-phosphate isomerase [Acidimicrobiales bacterium]|nr:triose-phosphate isomerase [Acidimicrobiales bacterium]
MAGAPARKPLISGNWKMHLTHLEAINVVQKFSYSLAPDDPARVDISIHPPFTALRSVQTVIEADDLPMSLGAQNVHWETSGAFTGEVSPQMLAKLNVSYVIVGHSERRQIFGETDEMVARKVKAVFAAGMTPIMCVGETIEEREAGGTEERVLGQLGAGLSGLDPEQVGRMVVAYEPIWAIGTGRTATPEDAQAVCRAIRAAVVADHGESAGATLRVQYGGSVKAGNAEALMGQPDIDGALVGGASLDPAEFAQIVGFTRI